MNNLVYLDYAATTPLRKEALDAMMPFLTVNFANPSSVYFYAQSPKVAIDNARRQIAYAINAQSTDIYFVSSGTEAINWALKTAIPIYSSTKKKHIITTATEHHSSLRTCQYMASNGVDVTFLPVDRFGRVSPRQVKDAIREDTALVNVILANNETGSLNPIAEIAKIVKEKNSQILFHTDAVAAVGHIPIDVQALGVDMLSLSAHKFGGPKGAGALFCKQNTPLPSYMHGGEQERGKRGGTQNVAAIVGMGAAIALAIDELPSEQTRISALRDGFIKEILQTIPNASLNGHPLERLPGNISFAFEGISAESLLIRLDSAGICASAGSACASGSLEPSHVLLAMGLSEDAAKSSLRISLGRETTEKQMIFAAERLIEAVNL